MAPLPWGAVQALCEVFMCAGVSGVPMETQLDLSQTSRGCRVPAWSIWPKTKRQKNPQRTLVWVWIWIKISLAL